MEPIAVDVPVKPLADVPAKPAPGSKPPTKDDPAAKKDGKDAPPKPAADAKPAAPPKAPPVPGLFDLLTSAAGNITRKQASIAATAVFTAIAGVSGYRIIWPSKPEAKDDTAAVQPLVQPTPPAAKSPPTPTPNPASPPKPPESTQTLPPAPNWGTLPAASPPATPPATTAGGNGGGNPFIIPVAPTTPPAPTGNGGFNIPPAPTTAAGNGGFNIPPVPAATGGGGYAPLSPAAPPNVNIERGTASGTALLPPTEFVPRIPDSPSQPRGGTGGVTNAGGVPQPYSGPSVFPVGANDQPMAPASPGATPPGGTGTLPLPELPAIPSTFPTTPASPAAPATPPPGGALPPPGGLEIPVGPTSPTAPPSTPPATPPATPFTTPPAALPPIPGSGVPTGNSTLPAIPVGPATPPASPSPGVFPPTTPPGSGTGVRIDSVKPPGSASVQPIGVNERSPSTSFDVDLHEAKTGETYESISREFYNDVKYARALAEFNRRKPLQNNGPVEVPPVHVLKKQFPQLVGTAAPVTPASGTGPAPNWGAAGAPPAPQPDPTFRAAATAKRSYTVSRAGMTLRDVAKELYGDERRWRDLYEANTQITAADEALRVGAEIKLPTGTPRSPE